MGNKYNILIVHNTLAIYRVSFFNELAKKNNISLIFFDLDANEKIYGDTPQVSNLSNIKGIYNYWNSDLKKILKKGNFDAILLPPIDDLKSLKVYLRMCKFVDRELKIIFWGMWEPLKIKAPFLKKIKKLCQRPVRRWALKKSDIAVTYGSKASEYLEFLGFNKSRIYPIINSTYVKSSASYFDIRKKFGLDNDAKIFIFMGRLVERKGVQILILAFKEVIKKNKNFRLLVCGEGEYYSHLSKMVNDLNLQRYVIFVGKVVSGERSIYYSQSNVMVVPSLLKNGYPEPWGLIVNEALQFGLPIIASDAVGAAYDLINKSNGLIVSQNDIAEMVWAMEKIVKIKYNEIGLYFTPKTMAENVYKAIEENLSSTKDNEGKK